MATAIEYGLIAAGISVVIIAVVQGLPTSRWDDNSDKKAAAQACATRPANTTNVVIKDWTGRKIEYECSNWPRLFYPSLVRRY